MRIILLNESIRTVKNRLTTAIVACEYNFGRIVKILAEGQDVRQCCTTEFIDGLVVVAHNRNIPSRLG